MSNNPQLIYQLDSELVQQFLFAAPFGKYIPLYIYNRLITFDHEVNLIWRRPSHRRTPVVPILYVLMHVSTPLYFLINITTCVYALSLAGGADTCVMYLTWGAISALRVYAINPRDWKVPAVVFALSLVPVATNLHRNILMVWEVPPPTFICTITNHVPARVQSICMLTCLEIATRVSTTAVDALVLLATWRVTYGVKRMSWHMLKTDIPITLLLMRDGTLYFGTLLVLNIFSALHTNPDPRDPQAIQDFDNFIYSFTTLLLSRLFFNLREVTLLQSTGLCADQASGDADVSALSWQPAQSADLSDPAGRLSSRSTTLGSLGSLALTSEVYVSSTMLAEFEGGRSRDRADTCNGSIPDASLRPASGNNAEEGVIGYVEDGGFR
ncbi:hypothetical protein EVJ58_g2515 [Rhodofomes roseus]|uniref:Uncharacterized protein n=1 Tax=Rhodofomes roseus TaxID=34475 RepID=A0A4Y9YS56_9APHY|nr:hypothetical protein EVJ58_g2515 [Rhodofomes roseus]